MGAKHTNSVVRGRENKAQNYWVIWVDGNINFAKEDFKKSLQLLRSVVSDVTICTTSSECINSLNAIDEGKAIVILSGALGQNLVTNIHHLPIVHTIYIFCANKVIHKQWADKWPKVHGVYTSITPICDSLKQVAWECGLDETHMAFVPKQEMQLVGGLCKQNLDELPPSYMYSILFKEIILEINDDEKQMADLIAYCRTKDVPEETLNNFQSEYNQKSPIWWYTHEMFLHGMLSKVLGSLDLEGMIKMGFFIRHLHLQLEQLNHEQSANFKNEFIVYRSQGLTQEDFQDLYDRKDGLLSFNNFLSTTKDRDVAMEFVQRAMIKHEHVIGVLFIMKIDPKKILTPTIPYALIDDCNAISWQQQILFTTNTIFRLIDIKQTAKNSRLWEIQLAITSDNDLQLAALTNQLREEISGSGWYRMGELMMRVGYFDLAENLYNELLKDTTNDKDRISIYHQLGRVKSGEGQYKEAASFFEMSLKISLETVPEDDDSLAVTYNSIALAYNNMGNHLTALAFYEKSLKIYENTLDSNHSSLATSYNNIGVVFSDMNNYSKALEFHEKSLKIYEKTLPPNHPNFATSFNNIGQVYDNMNHYSKALEFYGKALNIYEKVLPPNHHDLAVPYNNIGRIYDSMGDYPKALRYLEKSLSILQISLPLTHPHLTAVATAVELVKQKM